MTETTSEKNLRRVITSVTVKLVHSEVKTNIERMQMYWVAKLPAKKSQAEGNACPKRSIVAEEEYAAIEDLIGSIRNQNIGNDRKWWRKRHSSGCFPNWSWVFSYTMPIREDRIKAMLRTNNPKDSWGASSENDEEGFDEAVWRVQIMIPAVIVKTDAYL